MSYDPSDLAQHIKSLSKAVGEDEMLAWAWHCNFAMCAYDEGVSHKTANIIAARIMQMVFSVDMSKSSLYRDLFDRCEYNEEDPIIG